MKSSIKSNIERWLWRIAKRLGLACVAAAALACSGCVDVPLDFVVDTVCLPYDIFQIGGNEK